MWRWALSPKRVMDLATFSLYERDRFPRKTWQPPIKFVTAIPALAWCLLNLLSKKMAKSIVHSLAQMVILAQRNAAKAVIAADLQSFYGLLALPD